MPEVSKVSKGRCREPFSHKGIHWGEVSFYELSLFCSMSRMRKWWMASFAACLVGWAAGTAQGGSLQPLAPQDKPFVVVIDPGHGGIDPGALGVYSSEKEIALGVSLKLGKLLSQVPNVKVVYTRTTDMLPGGGTDKNAALRYRAALANRVGGDLFISIHCNSAPKIRHVEEIGHRIIYRRIHGRRVRRVIPRYRVYYTPNPAQGTEVYVWGLDKSGNKDLALRENAPLLNDSSYKAALDSSNDVENTIFWNTVQREYMNESIKLASKVENEFAKINRIDREVKQRQVGIWVLHATAMPSILIETGFISNPQEEDYLNHHQEDIAACICRAFVKYLASIRGVSPKSLEIHLPESVTQIPEAALNKSGQDGSSSVIYRIQLLQSDSLIADAATWFQKLGGPIRVEKASLNQSTAYKYLYGKFSDPQQAMQALDSVRLEGYQDAFLVTYLNGVRQ